MCRMESLRVHHAALTWIHAYVASVFSLCHGCHHGVSIVWTWSHLLFSLGVRVCHPLHQTTFTRVRHKHARKESVIINTLLCVVVVISDMLLRSFILILNSARCRSVLGHAGWLLLLSLSSSIILGSSCTRTFSDLHWCFDHFFSLDHLRNFLLQWSWGLSNNYLLHELLSFDVFNFFSFLNLIDLLNSSEFSICTFTSELLFNLRPSFLWLPFFPEFRIANDIIELPMIFQISFVSNIIFGLFLMVFSFKWINWSSIYLCIREFHVIVIGPEFDILLVLIQALASWLFVVSLLHCPIKLICWMASKFRKLRSMHTKYLLSKFSSHVLYHLLSSPLLQNLLVHRNNILLFKSKSSNAILTLLNPTLTIDMRFKILFKLLLVIEIVFLSFLK